jgi:hypothetical protein
MELIDIMNESIEIQQKDFFNKKFYYSFSSLSKLMWSPAAFYSIYVLGLREEKTASYLVNGKLIHNLLLEPEKFDQQFIVSPITLPGESVRKVLDRVFNHAKELWRNGDERKTLKEFENAVLDVLKDINLHQSLSTDQQRIDKIITPESTKYWDFLIELEGKTLIDRETYDYCKNAVDMMKADPELLNLLGINTTEFDNKEVFNELEFMLDNPNKNYGLKGIIDNLVIDHDIKKITINDVKTTSKDLKDFKESVEFYSYWLQAVIYIIFVSFKYQHLIANGNYQLEFNFVVIDKMFQVYPFKVSEATMNGWLLRYTEVMEQAEWHYDNKDYTLPYKFATKQVIL